MGGPSELRGLRGSYLPTGLPVLWERWEEVTQDLGAEGARAAGPEQLGPWLGGVVSVVTRESPQSLSWAGR